MAICIHILLVATFTAGACRFGHEHDAEHDPASRDGQPVLASEHATVLAMTLGSAPIPDATASAWHGSAA